MPVFTLSRQIVFALLLGIFLVFTRPLHAHPLGDFSINQYFVLDGQGEVLRVKYLLDVAEIPSFTELDLLDTDFNSEISQAEVDVYLAQRIPQLESFLQLKVNGEVVPLHPTHHKLVLLQGNGGMVVFNLLLDLEARDLPWPPDAETTVELVSENYPYEQGTHECLVLPGSMLRDQTPTPLEQQSRLSLEGLPGVYSNQTASFTLTLAPGTGETETSSPFLEDFGWTSTSRLAREAGEAGMLTGTAQATRDPEFEAEDSEGPSNTILSFSQDVDTSTVAVGTRERADTMANRLMDRVSTIVRAPTLPFPLLLLGLGIAALLGMGHALAPGHGKTVMAAYLIGERGTVWHACILGVVVTITHTWSVIFLGLVTLYFEGFLSENQVNFWTGILSGVIILVIGLVLFRQRYHRLLAESQDQPGTWRFSHGHDHGLEEVVAPVVDECKPPSYKNILWLGISGGVVPCPAALIVLLLALKVGRLSYGLVLLLAFSLGLAAVLVLIGILVVRASRLIRQQGIQDHGLFRILPLGSATLITLLGLWVVVWTLLQFQVLQFG